MKANIIITGGKPNGHTEMNQHADSQPRRCLEESATILHGGLDTSRQVTSKIRNRFFRIPDLGSQTHSFERYHTVSDNVLGKKFYNSLKIAEIRINIPDPQHWYLQGVGTSFLV